MASFHSFGILCLIFQVQYLHEVGRHEEGLLCTAVVLLQVDKEAEEECVHRHGVHREEAGGDEVGAWTRCAVFPGT